MAIFGIMIIILVILGALAVGGAGRSMRSSRTARGQHNNSASEPGLSATSACCIVLAQMTSNVISKLS